MQTISRGFTGLKPPDMITFEYHALAYIYIRPDFKFGIQSISDSCGQTSMAIVNHLKRKLPCNNGTTLYTTSRPRQNDRQSPDETFKRLILNAESAGNVSPATANR